MLWVARRRSSQSLTVGQSQGSTPDFTTSPATPLPSQPVFFNASGSRPAVGRTITSYAWDFGDGSPAGSGIQVSHTYAVIGVYTVTLTVTDDAGHIDTKSQSVSVGDDTPTAGIHVLANVANRRDHGCVQWHRLDSRSRPNDLELHLDVWRWWHGQRAHPVASIRAGGSLQRHLDCRGQSGKE